ncbi:hypothetical protein ACLQ3K_02270 [Tsukamurella sp. DT100]|uniref:hypothetical protein n=1 Tax=Tsukamurella sp. DT100 TaxID=3393415 RepID=UPI003CE91FA9
MRIEINPFALQHSITPDEIRTVTSSPSARYRVESPTNPDKVLIRSIGRIGNEPWIETLAEEYEYGELLHVFHSMILRYTVSTEAYHATGGAFDEIEDAPQRPIVRPQYTSETTPPEEGK